MDRSRGGPNGGSWTAGLPSYTSSTSLRSPTCGALLRTTEDMFFIRSAYLSVLTSSLFSTLAMFDELAQDEEDAEDYDLESLEHRTAARGLREDDDTATLVGSRVGDDAVVFEIGDEDGAGSDDEDAAPKKRRGEQHEGDLHEREGLMRDD